MTRLVLDRDDAGVRQHRLTAVAALRLLDSLAGHGVGACGGGGWAVDALFD